MHLQPTFERYILALYPKYESNKRDVTNEHVQYVDKSILRDDWSRLVLQPDRRLPRSAAYLLVWWRYNVSRTICADTYYTVKLKRDGREKETQLNKNYYTRLNRVEKTIDFVLLMAS